MRFAMQSRHAPVTQDGRNIVWKATCNDRAEGFSTLTVGAGCSSGENFEKTWLDHDAAML